VVVEAVPELVWIALLLVCLGLVYIARKFLEAMFGTLASFVGHVPYLGGAIHNALRGMEQAIDNALGSIYHGLDSQLGSALHHLAQLIEWTWRILGRVTVLGFTLSQIVAELVSEAHWTRNHVRDLFTSHTHADHRIRRLTRELHGIERQVKRLENDYSRGIGEDVLPRIKTLEREEANIRDVQLPAAIAAQRDTDSALSNLYEWAKGKAELLGIGTFAAAVGVALGTLGLDWLRCRNVGNAGRRLCGLGTDLLDALLLTTLVVEGSISLVGMAEELIRLSDEIVPAVTGFVSEFAGVTQRSAAEQGFA